MAEIQSALTFWSSAVHSINYGCFLQTDNFSTVWIEIHRKRRKQVCTEGIITFDSNNHYHSSSNSSTLVLASLDCEEQRPNKQTSSFVFEQTLTELLVGSACLWQQFIIFAFFLETDSYFHLFIYLFPFISQTKAGLMYFKRWVKGLLPF